MEQPKENDFLDARESLIAGLRKSSIGCDWRSDESQVINYDPLYHFISAVIYPQDPNNQGFYSDNAHNDEVETINLDNELTDYSPEEENQKKLSRQDQDDENDEKIQNTIDQSTQLKQSAFGLNCITEHNEVLVVEYGFSEYEQFFIKNDPETKIYAVTKTKDLKARAIRNFESYELAQNYLKDRTTKKYVIQERFKGEWGWRQIKHHGSYKFNITDTSSIVTHEINADLALRLSTRALENTSINTISISHKLHQAEGESYETHNCYFQVGFEVSTENYSFKQIEPSLQSNTGDEAKSLALLFRDKLSYATGNGCGTDWENSSAPKRVWTEFLPEYEVKSIEPTGDFDLKMNRLANINNKYSIDDTFNILNDLSTKYEDWINEQEEIISTIDEVHHDSAYKHIAAARVWSHRIDAGISYLKKSENAFISFRLLNLAMLIQANRLTHLKQKNKDQDLQLEDGGEDFLKTLRENNHDNLEYTWRPFQLAFVVGMIPDIVDPENNQTRDSVDLIWFPTGGGKTEAYLGVLGFSVIYRRIIDPEDDGVNAIMRYTLRLLTADQFRRSASLICALDFIRREKILSANLGTKQISIGLWLGKKANPLTHKAAISEWKRTDRNGNQTFMLSECPWCKTHLTNQDHSGYESRRSKLIIKCPDQQCYFHEYLPVYLWQEAIFDEKPTLLLATVDNFAKLAWLPGALNLFNDPDKSPPDLIIQDELHLISGPIGSMVGLYETVILKILERDGIKPKIIGATATLSIEGTQSKSLYRGRDSSIFPPQVLSWGDSFFAKEQDDKPGRKYLGFFGSSKGSMIESAFYAAIPLLQAVNRKLPTLLIDAVKGDQHIQLSDLEMTAGSKFSIFHKLDDEIKFTEYTIKQLVNEENSLQVELETPLLADILKGSEIYPAPSAVEDAINPYGTLVWYFNSKRELAYISNQEIRMNDVLKNNARFENAGKLGDGNVPYRFSRKIRQTRELTGRLSQDEIQSIILELRQPWYQVMSQENRKRGIDILYSTNMISVGVDITRLGLMLVHGHPRSTSEYIQATSRVGRQFPGLVVTVYNHAKSKDRSIYEMFKNYHQSFYKFVESVSVTPFSSGAREKALPAVFIGLARSFGVTTPALTSNDYPILDQAKNWLLESMDLVDPEERRIGEKEINYIISKWKNSQPESWGNMGGKTPDEVRLMGPSGSPVNQNTIFTAPTSMRAVGSGVDVQFFSSESGDEDDEF
jgi:hypothetical protein